MKGAFDPISLDRRSVMVSALLGAAVGAGGLPGIAAATGKTNGLDFSKPRDNLYALGKIHGTFAKDPVYPTFRGIMFGRSGDERSRPLFGYEGFSSIRMDMTAEGHLRWWSKEIAFYTDLQTGLPLDSWTNPYNGRTVKPMHFLNDHQLILLTDKMPEISFEGQEGSAGELGSGLSPQERARHRGPLPFVLPWTMSGDLAMVNLDAVMRYRNPLPPEVWKLESTGEFINPSEHYSFFASYSELSDRSKPSANFTGGFARTAPWWPWMEMGGVPGYMLTRAHMWQQSDTLDNVPYKIRAYVEAKHPEFLIPPTVWTDRKNPTTWEMYAASRRPAQ